MSATALTKSDVVFTAKKSGEHVQRPFHGKVGWRGIAEAGREEVIWFESKFDVSKNGWKTVEEFRVLAVEEGQLRRREYAKTCGNFARRGWRQAYRLLRQAMSGGLPSSSSPHVSVTPGCAVSSGVVA